MSSFVKSINRDRRFVWVLVWRLSKRGQPKVSYKRMFPVTFELLYFDCLANRYSDSALGKNPAIRLDKFAMWASESNYMKATEMCRSEERRATKAIGPSLKLWYRPGRRSGMIVERPSTLQSDRVG